MNITQTEQAYRRTRRAFSAAVQHQIWHEVAFLATELDRLEQAIAAEEAAR